MVEIVAEFVVKEEARGRFELTYGPGGAWGKLFSPCPGFRGTMMLRDTKNPRRYLTIDVWDTTALHEQALVERRVEVSDLTATLDQWIESRVEVGVFTVMAEATVRPRGGAGRSGRRATR